MDELDKVCNCCKETITEDNMHYIYCVIVATEEMLYYIGLIKIFEDFGDYIMTKNYHLSASQILLLRPDIVKEYLEQKYQGEKILDWYLERYTICSDCFKDYIDMVPLM